MGEGEPGGADDRAPTVRRSVHVHLSSATPRLEDLGPGLVRAAESAVALTATAIPLDAVEIVVYDEPDQAIPQWGVGGSTASTHLVLVAVDPAHPPEDRFVVRTVVHELHHAMRWRAQALEQSVGTRVVGEGLATLLEAELLGTPPFFCDQPLEPALVAIVAASLDARCDDGRVFFGAAELPHAFGYALGYELCRRYADANAATSRSLLWTPAHELTAQLATLLDH